MQRDKLTNRQADRERDGQIVTQSERHDKEADRQTHRHRDGQKRKAEKHEEQKQTYMYRQTGMLVHRDRQDRQTERKSDRQSRDRRNDKHTARRERERETPHTHRDNQAETIRDRQIDRYSYKQRVKQCQSGFKSKLTKMQTNKQTNRFYQHAKCAGTMSVDWWKSKC